MAKHILVVVEDDEDRKRLGVVIRRAGFEVSEVPSGTEALVLAQENQIDLIICEYMMAGVDGLSLATRLRELRAYRSTPVLVVSDMVHGRLRARAKQVRAILLRKPIPEHVLVARIMHSLAHG